MGKTKSLEHQRRMETGATSKRKREDAISYLKNQWNLSDDKMCLICRRYISSFYRFERHLDEYADRKIVTFVNGERAKNTTTSDPDGGECSSLQSEEEEEEEEEQ